MSILKEFLAKVGTEDEIFGRMQSILNPGTDEDEMGEIFRNTIGYNPITHYDEVMIKAKIKDLTEDNEYLYKIVQKIEDDVVANVLDKFKEMKKDNLEKAIIDTLYEIDKGHSDIYDDYFSYYDALIDDSNDFDYEDPDVRFDEMVTENDDTDALFEDDDD